MLAPAIGELLSGSSPPAEFFNPIAFLMLAILYGGGALLARELTFRWGKGWATLLTLGAAYGVIEEGLMVKSFFDPAWVDLDILGVYGRWAGVNWVWAVELTLFHAVFSITIPVILVGLLFPEQQERPWISPRAFRRLAILFVLNGVFIFFALTPYRPPFLPYAAAAVLVGWLYRRARRLPPDTVPVPDRKPAPMRSYFLTGFLGTVALFFFSWVLPNLEVPVFITLLLLIGLPFLVRRRLRKMAGRGEGWPRRHLWALASGTLSFFISLAPLQELDNAARPDNTAGMTLIGLGMAALLVWIGRRIRQHEEGRERAAAVAH